MRFAYLNTRADHYIDADEAQARLLAHRGWIAVDTETIALKGDKNVIDDDEIVAMDAKTCIGVGIAISPYEGFYFPLGEGHKWANVPEVNLDPLRDKLSRMDETKWLFNCIFDLDRVEEAPALGIKMRPYQDLSLSMRVQGLWNSLDQCAGNLMGEDHTTIDEVLPARKTMLDLPYEVTSMKCIHDCLSTYQLVELSGGDKWSGHDPFTWTDWVGRSYDVTQGQLDCYQKDLLCTDLLRRMSQRGIALHEDRLFYWNRRLTDEMRNYERIFATMGFNPSKNIEVGYMLAERGNWLPLTKSGKAMKVDEDTILDTNDPAGIMVLEWRKRRKLKSTYVTPMIRQERFHTHYRLDLATGRLASSDRNIQNIPGENYQGLKPTGEYNVRDILAANDTWSWMDFSQAEMRAFAYLSKDPVMLSAYANDESVHEITLEALWPGLTKKANPDYYTLAKTYNFAMIFDASVQTLARQTRRPFQECLTVRTNWLAKYNVGHAWMMSQADQGGDWVENQYGRRMRIPDAIYITPDHKRKCRINYPVQGLIADVVKRGMLLMDELGYDIPIQAHDELVQDGNQSWPKELSTIHPELYLPFEEHQGTYWK